MRVSNLIILGPQGSGKGTQAKLLAGRFNFAVLGAGDLLREIAKTDTELGRKIDRLVNVEGRLADDELIAKVFEGKLRGIPLGQGIIMDGFPRTPNQYQLMKNFWSKLGRKDYQVIFVDLPEEESVKRISARRICENCGAIYIAGQAPEKCTKCGGKLIQRADDKPDAVRKRLKLFQTQTKPLIDIFQKEGRLIKIDGAPSIEEVHRDIVKKLKLE